MPPFGADFHVHTTASWCAGAEMVPEAIAATAVSRGVAVIGLADHLWLDPRRGTRPAIERLLRTRHALAGHDQRVRILLGAEADCAPGRGVAGGAGCAASGIVKNDSTGGTGLLDLDYAVAAYHFADVREGATEWPRTPEELAEILLAGFQSVVDAPGATVAGHPFFIPPSVYRRFPASLQKNAAAALALVIRRAGAIFRTAANRGLAIELNVRALGPYNRRVLLPLFQAAADAGCGFVVSTDAHRLGELGRGGVLEDYLSSAGVTPALLDHGDAAATARVRRNMPRP